MRVVEQNQHLVLNARVGGYRLAVLDDLLYKQRRLVEVKAHIRCIVPIEAYPVFQLRFAQLEAKNRPDLTDLEPLMTRALDRISEEGPLSSLDFTETARAASWWTKDARAMRMALEWLWHFGRVAVSHRVGTRRYFDLPERLFGDEAMLPPYEPGGTGDQGAGEDDEASSMRDHLLRRYLAATGLMDPRDWSFGWTKYKPSTKLALVERLVAAGDIVRVAVEGVETSYYVLSEDVEELAAAADMELAPDLHILPPLDNLIWLRSRTSDLFNFEYRWEAYVPAAKRTYGPYTCPLLFGDALVGRVDAVLDRKQRKLNVNGVWWEPSAPRPTDAELKAALDQLTEVCCGASTKT